MYGEKAKYWKSYEGKKANYMLFLQRIRKDGLSFEEAIKPKSRKLKTKVTLDGRVCTRCKVYKAWCWFCVDNSPGATHGHTTECKECRNAKKKILRANPDFVELERKYKRDRRLTEKGKLQKELDNKFYTNKQIKKNRIILKQVRKPTREEARIAKIQYFYFSGVSIEKLKKAYGDFDQYTVLRVKN